MRNLKVVEPLPLKADCWLFQGMRPKQVQGKWLVQLLGPGPWNGRWEKLWSSETEVSLPEDEALWRWVPKEGPEAGAEGEWRAIGAPPRFQDEMWIFVGRAPELGFFRGIDPLGFKFRALADGMLEAAMDSRAALAAVPRLMDPPRQKAAPEAEAPEPAVQKLRPTVSALGLGFVVSEVLQRPGAALTDSARRIHASFRSACRGARIELWLHGTSGWSLIASDDGRPGSRTPKALGAGVMHAEGEGVYVPVLSETAPGGDEKLLGGLWAEGPVVPRLPQEYFAAIAPLLRGLMMAWDKAR